MAGSEAAWAAVQQGVPVVIHEMRPTVGTFAHQTGHLAEMVCSNSFRSDDDEQNAVGLLHWEMRAAGGLIMEMADRHRLPAGGAPGSFGWESPWQRLAWPSVPSGVARQTKPSCGRRG